MSHEPGHDSPERTLVFAIIYCALMDAMDPPKSRGQDSRGYMKQAKWWLEQAEQGDVSEHSLRWWLSFVADDPDGEADRVLKFYRKGRANKLYRWRRMQLRRMVK